MIVTLAERTVTAEYYEEMEPGIHVLPHHWHDKYIHTCAPSFCIIAFKHMTASMQVIGFSKQIREPVASVT